MAFHCCYMPMEIDGQERAQLLKPKVARAGCHGNSISTIHAEWKRKRERGRGEREGGRGERERGRGERDLQRFHSEGLQYRQTECLERESHSTPAGQGERESRGQVSVQKPLLMQQPLTIISLPL